MKRNAVWALSNLCRGKNPPPDFAKVSPALPILAHLLFFNDTDVLADTCWALSYLSDGPNEKVQAVIGMYLIRVISVVYCLKNISTTLALFSMNNTGYFLAYYIAYILKNDWVVLLLSSFF